MTTQGCVKRTAGGKGNFGRFIDRNPQICAAGVPTQQPEITLPDGLQQFLLVDEVNALINDAIIPLPPPRPLGPLYYPIEKDQRYCSGAVNSDLAKLVSPPVKTKFQSIVEDLKETVYSSYWKKRLGRVPDCTHMFPNGYDIEGTRYGRKSPEGLSLYDTICPSNPVTGQYNPSKEAGFQTFRNYCQPAFNPDLTFGQRSRIDKRGKLMKCALTDDRIVSGKGGATVLDTIQSDFEEAYQPSIGKVLSPCNNISEVPEGHRFGLVEDLASEQEGTLKQCLTTCDLNPGREFYLKCLAYVNSLRISMSKIYPSSFFKTFYNNLKYMDKEKTGWLPAEDVVRFSLTKHIKVDLTYIGPLLEAWNAFDGKRIEYKTFCNVVNFDVPFPDLPKIEDVSPECLDFQTTYGEMTKPGQDTGPHFMAGAPSGRYFDRDYPVTVDNQCSAHKMLLPMETDTFSCIYPSIMTSLNVNHRDMYAKREPHVVKRVFEASGEKFTEERFKKIWEEAKKYHSLGLVSYETFRRALQKFPEDENKHIENPSKSNK